MACTRITLTPTNSTDHSRFWDAYSCSASHELPRILWNPTVHCRVLNSRPPVPMLSWMNLVHTLSPYFFQINFNSILPSTPMSTKWSFSFGFPHQNYVRISLLTHACHLFGWVNLETCGPSFVNLRFRISPANRRLSIIVLCLFISINLPAVSYFRYWSE